MKNTSVYYVIGGTYQLGLFYHGVTGYGERTKIAREFKLRRLGLRLVINF